jgi:hypothetical protein
MEISLDQFKNPSVEHRGKPFWSWNGQLDKDELFRQIQVMKDMGMGGFFMHSRTGLETEYLGDEWFELINACADKGAELGLEAWLYDEDRWPSGLAGGLVSKHPEFRQKGIILDISTKVTEPSDVLAQWVAKCDGVQCHELEPFEGSIPEGKVLLTFKVIEQGKSGFYNGYTYIDTMNRKATEAFLESTHEKYAKFCGDRLGKSIKGIFTDEPHRGALLDGFSMYMENGEYTLPYTYSLFDEFSKRFGYDLLPHLPELFLQMEGKRISKVKWHYVELLQQLFLENYAIPCQEWCEKHGLVLTGHVLHEDNLTAQTAMSGSVMRYYEHMTSPGVDVLSEGNKNYWIVKQLTSAARQTGKKQLLSELYGCTGWQMPFAGHKAVGDWQALLGVNLRCHHLSWYTMGGEAKRDYPASILHQSAWYKEYKTLEDYFSRFGMMLREGKPDCQVLVLNPVETFWSQVHLGWSKGLALQDEHLKTLEDRYASLFTMLMEAHIDFDYGDEEMLSRLGSVGNGYLALGKCSYTHVLISGMETMRSTTLEILKKFVTQGGNVLMAGEAPTHLDAEVFENIESEYEGFGRCDFELQSMMDWLPKPKVNVDSKDIFVQVRTTQDKMIIAALNVNREQSFSNVKLSIMGQGHLEFWDCHSGEVTSVDQFLFSDGWTHFEFDFAAGESRLWIFNQDKEKNNFLASYSVDENQNLVSHRLNGPFQYSLSESNICVLDEARFRMGSQSVNIAEEVLKIDQKVRDSISVPHRGGEMLQPWFTALSKEEEGRSQKVELHFDFKIEAMPKHIDLVMEDVHSFRVLVNGHEVELDNLQPWIDISFQRIPLPKKHLFHGENCISISCDYHKNSNLEAIYLLGDFGVVLNQSQRVIVAMPQEIEIGDLVSQGFPFYTGSIRYQVNLPKEARKIEMSDFGGACVNVVTYDSSSLECKRVLGWAPYSADLCGESELGIEVVMTRKNTFGPLHDAVKDRSHNGPDHWITTGKDFSKNPILIASGLLEAPVVYCKA